MRVPTLLLLSVSATSLTACSDFQSVARKAASASHLSQLSHASAYRAPGCDGIRQKLNTGIEASADLQACIDATPEGEILEIPPGRLMVAKTVRLNHRIVLKSQGRGDDLACELNDPGCLEIRATSDALPDNGTGIFTVTGTGATLRNVIIDGNRAERLNSVPLNTCLSGNNGLGFTMSATGESITVEGVVAKNAICGTGFYAQGSGLHINRNLIANNGDHKSMNQWSDGMTVSDVSSSDFIGNTFIDNTDVDFIFGGAQNSRIQLNTVLHTDNSAGGSFAAIMLHAWPDGGTSGNYSGTDVSNNSVDCGSRRHCGIGLNLGAEGWYSSPLFGGFFHDNSVRNALVGFLVERASGLIRIKDNTVTNSGGQMVTSVDSRLAYDYNIPDFTNVQIEDTLIPRSAYHQVSYSRVIPNFWTSELPWETAETVAAAAAEPGGLLANTVSNVYRRLLEREPDLGGQAGWVAYLRVGYKLADLETEFRRSDEYRRKVIAKLYRSYLQREPDASGLDFWVSYLQVGHTVGEVALEFLHSQEYLSQNPM